MSSFNKVILMGNLTRDPQVRYTPSGSAVTELGLAVNRTWFDKQTNSKKEDTTFVDVTVWGRTAEVAGEYLTKGRPVLIEGRLQLDQWQDKESGQNRSKLKVVCENMTMLSSGGSGGGQRGGGGGGNYQGNQGGGAPQGGGGAPQGGPPQNSGPDPSEAFYDSGPNDDVPF